MKTYKVLLTGATGLVGSYIARSLVKDGHTVFATRRKRTLPAHAADLADAVQWIDAELEDLILLEDAFTAHRFDVVVHAAAIVSYHKAYRAAMQKINVEGTATIVNLCLKYTVAKLVHISSIAAISKTMNKLVCDEQYKWDPSLPHTYYGFTKHLAELEVWRGQVEGLSILMFNPSVVLGPGEWKRSSTQLFDYVKEEKPFYTEGLLNYVDVRDVAEAVRSSIAQELEGQYLLNAGAMTYQDAFATIASQMGKRAPRIKIGPKTLKWAALANALISRVLFKKPSISIEIARMGKNLHTYSNHKATSQLGLRFTQWEDSIEWCVKELQKKDRKIL
jgi:dihydroflavonol-4-reductase